MIIVVTLHYIMACSVICYDYCSYITLHYGLFSDML